MPVRKYVEGRIRPRAVYAPNESNNATRGKPIMVSFGRGDARLTTEEAQSLQGELYRAIVSALSGDRPSDGG